MYPVVIVESGGLPVTEAESGFGWPVTPTDGYGLPVTLVNSGGLPVVGTTPVATFASGTLSFDGNVVLNDQITIGGVTYSFVNSLVTANDVLIGGSASQSRDNLVAAINAAAGEGVVYGTGTVEHPDVAASSAPGVMNVTAKIAGPDGNSIATTSTSATATWGAATLEGGA